MNFVPRSLRVARVVQLIFFFNFLSFYPVWKYILVGATNFAPRSRYAWSGFGCSVNFSFFEIDFRSKSGASNFPRAVVLVFTPEIHFGAWLDSRGFNFRRVFSFSWHFSAFALRNCAS